MNSSNYDRVIAEEQKVLASIKEHGDKINHEFKKRTISYLREWSINLMKSFMTHKPEITNNLSAQKSEEMKGEFKGILERLPEQAGKRLDDPQIWLHRLRIPDHAISDMTYSYQLEKNSTRSMDQAIRDLISPVGSLLIKYGFMDIEENYDWEMTSGGIPKYTYDLPSKGMEHHKALSKLMEEYKNILVEYVYASQNLRKAEQAKKSAEAD